MSRQLWVYFFVSLVLLGVGAGVGILGWQWVTAGSGDPSEPISAPTLDVNAEPTFSQAQAEAYATEAAELRAEVSALSTQAAGVAAEPEVPAESDESETDSDTEAQNAETGDRIVFRISQEESEARFYIEETLAGNRITVVGVTDQVAGDVLVDFSAPSLSRVGTIRINARTLATDNGSRNRALRSSVLQSARDEYEFIEFANPAITGLPDAVAVGDTVTFEITGDLTVRDITRQTTFTAEVMLVAEDRIEGIARADVRRGDFSLVIPNVPNVSDVSDDVVLEIEFVALAVDEE